MIIKNNVTNNENPRLIIEVVDGKELHVSTEWQNGDDVGLFGHVLAYACRGDLMNLIKSAVVVNAQKISNLRAAEEILNILDQMNTKFDKPVVCPTEAIRFNFARRGQEGL